MVFLRFVISIVVVAVVLSGAFSEASQSKSTSQGPRDNYQIWCQGNCNADAKVASTRGGAVLMGGGTDTDEAFVWQINNAAGGDFVVIRSSGDDAYNPYIMELSQQKGNTPLNSVRTILFKNAKATSEQEVLDVLSNAEAIFLAGGDQSDYLSFWSGTQVQSILQSKVSSNVTIGGTSAGCAVMGNWVYSGEKGSATSDEALLNPYDKYITIVPAFLHVPFLESIITDTHFVTRDRMGRLFAFEARLLKDAVSPVPKTVRGVGIDEHTALLLDVNSGDVTAVGVGTAYVCLSNHPAEICKSGTPLTFQDVSCTRLSARNADTYSFKSFSGKGTDYTSNVAAGKFLNLPYGPI